MDVIKISIITVNYNGSFFLEQAVQSVINQQAPDVEVEYIVIDGGSTDGSLEIISRYDSAVSRLVVEPDSGPANAINKGFDLATGDVVAWLNSDDYYYPGTLERVRKIFDENPNAPFCFGACPIVDTEGNEIRGLITGFKELFFPVSSRFTYQCINYISQPAFFFRRSAMLEAGHLREGLKAAWDYEFILRLWRQGKGVRVQGSPLSAFRWHEGSISGTSFVEQFKEEFQAAVDDAGWLSAQALLHFIVRWGIVSAYHVMAGLRRCR